MPVKRKNLVAARQSVFAAVVLVPLARAAYADWPDCGPLPCSQLRSGPEPELTSSGVTIDPPLCINPSGSEYWTAEDWALHFGPGAFDHDEKRNPRWTYRYNGQGELECDSIQWGPWNLSEGGPVEAAWSLVGDPPDLTTEGTYTLKATLTNPADSEADAAGCYDWVSDPPVDRYFTITVTGPCVCGFWTLSEDMTIGVASELVPVLNWNNCQPNCRTANLTLGVFHPNQASAVAIAGNTEEPYHEHDVQDTTVQVLTAQPGIWRKTWRWENRARPGSLSKCPAAQRTFTYVVSLQGSCGVSGNADTNNLELGLASSSVSTIGTVILTQGDDRSHQINPPYLECTGDGNATEVGVDSFSFLVSLTGFGLGLSGMGEDDHYASGPYSGNRTLCGSAKGGGDTKEVSCEIHFQGQSECSVRNTAFQAAETGTVSEVTFSFQ